jgi:hypothetical protein
LPDGGIKEIYKNSDIFTDVSKAQPLPTLAADVICERFRSHLINVMCYFRTDLNLLMIVP